MGGGEGESRLTAAIIAKKKANRVDWICTAETPQTTDSFRFGVSSDSISSLEGYVLSVDAISTTTSRQYSRALDLPRN